MTVSATCPAGSALLGGGYFTSIAHAGANPVGNTWYAIVDNQTGITITGLQAYAVCGARWAQNEKAAVQAGGPGGTPSRRSAP